MRFVKDLFLGYQSYIKAFSFIKDHKLWRYFIFPLILFGLIFYAGHYFEQLKLASEDARMGDIGFFENAWLWIKEKFQALMSFIFLDATKYVIMIVLSPLIATLSERTEKILTGNTYKFNLKQTLKDVRRGIGIAIRMFIAESVLVYVIWWPVSAILGVSEPVFLFVQTFIGFYFYGFGYIDYINERLRMSISQSWKFMRKHAGLAISIGSLFSLLFYVPSLFSTGSLWGDTILDNIGVIIAPVLAIVAATLAMHKLVDLRKNRFATKEKK